MSTYELTFLLIKEEELKTIKDLLTSYSAKLLKEEAWGKKTLAYPIKKERSVSFYNWTISIDETKVKDLRQKLNFNEKLLRYLLLTVDKDEVVEKKPKKA